MTPSQVQHDQREARVNAIINEICGKTDEDPETFKKEMADQVDKLRFGGWNDLVRQLTEYVGQEEAEYVLSWIEVEFKQLYCSGEHHKLPDLINGERLTYKAFFRSERREVKVVQVNRVPVV